MLLVVCCLWVDWLCVLFFCWLLVVRCWLLIAHGASSVVNKLLRLVGKLFFFAVCCWRFVVGCLLLVAGP